jgi:hypothetical protein
MSGWESARSVIARLASRSETERLFAGETRALRQIAHGDDVYEMLAGATRGTLRLLRERLGRETLEAVQTISSEYAVTRAQAQEYYDWLMQGMVVGRHVDNIAMKAGTPLSRLVESDHVVEQRVLRMLRDGPAAHGVRSPGTALVDPDAHRRLERAAGALACAEHLQMDEAMAILVPANHVAGYRFSRYFRELSGGAGVAPWFYIHQGIGSKTSWMRHMIPWRLEGAYTYQELLDATRWVMTYRMNLPRDFETAIRGDMIEEIVQMIVENADEPEVENILLTLGLRSATDESRIIAALESRLTLNPLDYTRFEQDWNYIAPLVGPADEMRWSAEEAQRVAEAARQAEGGS